MTTEISCCYEDDDVKDAARLIKEKQFRRLPVMNRQNRIVGIISLGDLALRSDEDGLAEETLEGVSEK